MGIADHIRQTESWKKDRAEQSAQDLAKRVGRLGEANRQLQQLILEATPLLRERNHPFCIEILRIDIKEKAFWGPAIVKQIVTGRRIQLLRCKHVWGQGSAQWGHVYGISDVGDLIKCRLIETPHPYDTTGWENKGKKWIALDGVGGIGVGFAKNTAIPAVRARAEKSNCVAAGVDFETVRAFGQPQRSGTNQNDPNEFFLDSNNRLRYGNENHNQDAEQWFGTRMAEE